MGDQRTLKAEDGHEFAIYSAEPRTKSAAGEETAPGLIVIQEIFGVNPHIRSVCDGFAGQGYRVVAPALFDRVQRGIELEYGEKGFKVGVGLRKLIPENYSMMDVAACLEHLRGDGLGAGSGGGNVAVVGYCWGGTLAWVAAQQLDVQAAVGYYGGGIAQHLDGDLYCPVMLHFGGEDRSITPGDILAIQQAYPQAKIHSYPGAGHGFNREAQAEHTTLALDRTLEFLRTNMVGS
ncbi:MAG: dienelactone hydrolase family protein [Alphaproteobacteria bacterium]|jgi:carboxymethylenebutenolidase|nr:dienelactone hydrolase family protein [Alphaproteobacteria bacterium]